MSKKYKNKKKAKINQIKKNTIPDKTLMELDVFLKKNELPNSIKTSSELLGYFASIICAPDCIEQPHWFFRIWSDIDLDITLGESAEERLEFENLSFKVLEDTCEYIAFIQTYDSFIDNDKINLMEWCKGFLRGRMFWTPYFGPIFEIDKGNHTKLNLNKPSVFNTNNLTFANVYEDDNTLEDLEGIDEVISKDIEYHKTPKENEYDDTIRVNALAFIGLVSSLGEPELSKINFGVLTTIDDTSIKHIPPLIFYFYSYLRDIDLEYRREYLTESELEETNNKIKLNEDKKVFVDLPQTNLGSSFKSIASTVINQIPKGDRNDPCPCGSGKKYKKCCFLNKEEK